MYTGCSRSRALSPDYVLPRGFGDGFNSSRRALRRWLKFTYCSLPEVSALQYYKFAWDSSGETFSLFPRAFQTTSILIRLNHQVFTHKSIASLIPPLSLQMHIHSRLLIKTEIIIWNGHLFFTSVSSTCGPRSAWLFSTPCIHTYASSRVNPCQNSRKRALCLHRAILLRKFRRKMSSKSKTLTLQIVVIYPVC